MLLLHVYLINNNWIQCCFGRLNPQLAGQILFCLDVSAEHYYTIKYMETTTFKNYFEQWTGFHTGTVSGGRDRRLCEGNWEEGRWRYFSHEHCLNLGSLRLLLLVASGACS